MSGECKKIVYELCGIMLSAFFYLIVFTSILFMAAYCIARAHSAPLPRAKVAEKADTRVGAGHYDLSWNGSSWKMSLASNGIYEASCGEQKWIGSWGWEDKTRTFHVQEREQNSQNWMYWSAVLPESLDGEALLYQNSFQDEPARKIPVKLEKKAK